MPCLFDETNIESLFKMMDPSEQGFISLQQYRQGLITLGITQINMNVPGRDDNKISMDTFMREA